MEGVTTNKVGLKPIATNLNAITVIKTGKIGYSDDIAIMFSTLQGEVYIIQNGDMKLMLDIKEEGNICNLMGFELHKHFQTSGKFYVCYSNETNIVVKEFAYAREHTKMVTRLLRDILKINKPDTSTQLDSMNCLTYDLTLNKLILCTGVNEMSALLSQNDNKPQGKLIAIDVNGYYDCECSFYEAITNMDQIKACHRSMYEIIGKGLQNPCSLIIGKTKYLIDRGSITMDEINTFTEYGKNYGWNAWEGIYPRMSVVNNTLTLTDPIEYGINLKNHHKPSHVIPIYEEGHITGGCMNNGKYVFCAKYGKPIRGRNVGGSIKFIDPNDSEIKDLQVMYDFKGRNHYYTAIHSSMDSEGRMFLGVYGSEDLTECNKGTLFEIVKYEEPIKRLDTTNMPALF